MESDGHARSTCGVRELRDAPVRRSVRQRAAAARRPTSIVCWWQLGDAGGAENRRRAPATTGHRAAACDQHDTRRHTATSLMMMLLLRPPAAPRGSATGSSGNGGIERSALSFSVSLTRAEILARAREGAALMMALAARRQLGGGVRQHPGSTTALRGLMASLALRSARPWRAMGMRDRPAGCASCATRLCGALCGSGRPPRGGRRRSFVGGNWAMLAAPRAEGRRP